MKQSWYDQIVVTEDLARGLIEEQFPQLGPATVAPLGFGWDNTAYRINQEFVFRFPRRPSARDSLYVELASLSKIAALLPIRVPYPRFVGQPSDPFPWIFAGFSYIEGRCASSTPLKERADLAAPLGSFLSTLHSLGAEWSPRRGVSDGFSRQRILEERIPNAKAKLLQVRHLLAAGDFGRLMDLVEQAGTISSATGTLALVHGDLYAEHLIVDQGALCGVIDWGDMHIGYPALDLAIAHSFLPPVAQGRFREAYGFVTDADWQLARFRALSLTLHTLVYACTVGKSALEHESIEALQLIRDGV